MHVCIITMFPEMFPGNLQYSLAGTALKKSIWSYDIINLHDFGLTKHKKVDDEPYGGGHGLIARADVLGKALDCALSKHPNSTIYYPTPRGKLLKQSLIKQISCKKTIIIICGRFEGIDERVIVQYNVSEVSVGDYILSGGEVAAFVILDSVIRLLPGVLANRETLLSESFELDGEFRGLLEPPLYTRPEEWLGNHVPDVLLSGHHKKIIQWKQEQSLASTIERRPDLLKNLPIQ